MVDYGQIGPLRDVDQALLAPSDDLILQVVAGAFARLPLSVDALRDVKLIAFLIDIGSNRYAADRIVTGEQLWLPVLSEQLIRDSGLPAPRVREALQRLEQAGVLSTRSSEPGGWQAQFSPAVLSVVGSIAQVSWGEVLVMLQGRTPALLILRAVLDLIPTPWNWTRLTYEALALRACYSIGMAQRGMAYLLESGILERVVRTGRGHDYRLSDWALGRAARGQLKPLRQAASSPEVRRLRTSESVQVPRSLLSSGASEPSVASSLAVEIGDLTLRVPVGTEIRMLMNADGSAYYEIGPDLKITRR